MLKDYTRKQKAVIGLWAACLIWILMMTIRSTDWRFADRSSVGLAPLPSKTAEAVVQVYAARTYSWRGAFAVHSWIAVKPEMLINIRFIKLWAGICAGGCLLFQCQMMFLTAAGMGLSLC